MNEKAKIVNEHNKNKSEKSEEDINNNLRDAKNKGKKQNKFELCNDFFKSQQNPKLKKQPSNNILNDFIMIDNSTYSNKNVLTEEEWEIILKHHKREETINNENKKISESLEYGIPPNLRDKIWIYLSQSETLEMNYSKNFYCSLLKSNGNNNPSVHNINKDIQRTFFSPSFNKEEMKIKLFNILCAYSLFDKSHGYAQGTNFIVLTILKIIENEKDAFWVFLSLMLQKYWKDIYVQGSEKLNSLLGKLRFNLKLKVPKVYEYLNQCNFFPEFPAAFSQYFYTLFSYGDYEELSFKIFDLFWIYGGDIIIETLLNAINLSQYIILQQSPEMLCTYFSQHLITTVIDKHGIDKCIPKLKLKKIWSYQNIQIQNDINNK